MTTRGQSHRLPGLDGLRGIAILLVIASHTTLIRSETLGSYDSRLFQVARIIPDMGWTGVDLFFILSGFLITTILLEARGQAHFFRNFYARRALRIIPLYYAVIAFSFFILPRLGAVGASIAPSEDVQWPYWLFLSNYHLALLPTWPGHVLQITWSLSIEEQFYLLWPLAVFAFDRRGMICFCSAVILIAIAIRTAAVFTDHPGMMLYASTFCRMDSLATGGLVALIAKNTGGIARWKMAGIIGLPLSLTGVGAVIAHDRTLFWAAGGWGQSLGYTLLATAAASAVILSLTMPSIARVLSFPPLALCGRLSYCMYLAHVSICSFVLVKMFPDGVPMIAGSIWLAQALYFGAVVGATVLVAWLSWICYERWFLCLKRYFPMPAAAVQGNPDA